MSGMERTVGIKRAMYQSERQTDYFKETDTTAGELSVASFAMTVRKHRRAVFKKRIN